MEAELDYIHIVNFDKGKDFISPVKGKLFANIRGVDGWGVTANLIINDTAIIDNQHDTDYGLIMLPIEEGDKIRITSAHDTPKIIPYKN